MTISFTTSGTDVYGPSRNLVKEVKLPPVGTSFAVKIKVSSDKRFNHSNHILFVQTRSRHVFSKDRLTFPVLAI